MSYLTLDKGVPNHTKAVISLWFRVPQASIEAAAAASAPNNLIRTIPLITWGDAPVVEAMEPNSVDIATAVDFPQEDCPPVISVTGYASAGTFKLDPCYIGVRCDGGTATLDINIQTAGHAAIASYAVSVTLMEVWSLLRTLFPPGEPDLSPGTGWNDLGYPFVGLASGVEDFSDYLNAVPERFHVWDDSRTLAADHWHHLLLSYDLGNACDTQGPPQPGDGGSNRWDTIAQGTSSFCRLWYTLDDENFNGEDHLGPFFVDGGANPNAILTDNAWSVADAHTGMQYNLPEPVATCAYPSEAIPTLKPVGVPASSAFEVNIYPVELAELQFFTGVTLDTSVTAIRRLFIDADGKPVPPIAAEKALGKKPDILLHGSGNWIAGRNTSTDPAEPLQPTGKIVAYTPEPSLHGPQGSEVPLSLAAAQ